MKLVAAFAALSLIGTTYAQDWHTCSERKVESMQTADHIKRVWQSLGLSRYEVLIESRLRGWIDKNLSIPVEESQAVEAHIVRICIGFSAGCVF